MRLRFESNFLKKKRPHLKRQDGPEIVDYVHGTIYAKYYRRMSAGEINAVEIV